MITPAFWPLLNHMLTVEEAVGFFDATPVLLHLAPLLPSLEEKTPSDMEKKIFSMLANHVDQYRVAPTRVAFMMAMMSLASPTEVADLQDFSSQIQMGMIVRYGVSDAHMLLDHYEHGRDTYLAQFSFETFMKIIVSPQKINGKQLQGFDSALDYIQRAYAGLGTSSKYINSFDLAENGEEAFATYLAEVDDAATCMKMYTGLPEVDSKYNGFRKSELITLMGYTGDGKTTVSINWAYQAFLQGFNVVYVSLELPIEDIKKRFHVRHAANTTIFNHGPIFLTTYMDRLLSDEEAHYMFRTVVPDFTRNSAPGGATRGSIRILEPKEDGFTFELLKSELLKLHAEYPLDVFFLDYPNLMDVEPGRGQDFNKAMARLYVKLKTLCRTFNDGDRLIGFIPTQVNRNGREAAEKAQGIYTLRAIQEHSEIANSSDFVFAVYRDSLLKSDGECLFSNPKARRAGEIDPFKATFAGATCEVGAKNGVHPSPPPPTSTTSMPIPNVNT